MRRRTILTRAVGCAVVAGAAACSSEARLRLGVHPWIGYEPLQLASDFGWLDERLELVNGRSATDSIQGLLRGRLEGAALTLDETLSVRAADTPVVVVLVADVSAGADMLLARPELTSMTELRGKRIAIERSAVGELMLVHCLDRAGLRRHEVDQVAMPVDAQAQAWRHRQIDAAISYEPTASRLMREGARRLFDSRALPETIFDVLAVRREVARRDPSLVRALITGHLRGLRHLRANRGDALYRIAARLQLDVAEARAALAGISLPDLQRNRSLLGPDARLLRPLQDLMKLMLQHKLLPTPDALEDLFADRYLPGREVAA